MTGHRAPLVLGGRGAERRGGYASPWVLDAASAVVDDVISTGGSTKAALNLLRRVGAEPVVVGAVVTEGAHWRSYLGEDAKLVQSLGAIPLFRHGADGSLVEDWEGLGGSTTAQAASITHGEG